MKAAAQLQLMRGAIRPLSPSSSATSVLRRKCACESSPLDAGGHCAECENKKPLQRKASSDPSGAAWAFDRIPLLSPEETRRTHALQRKLTIGSVDDPLEHEADRVADQVMRVPHPDYSPIPASLQVRPKGAQDENPRGSTEGHAWLHADTNATPSANCEMDEETKTPKLARRISPGAAVHDHATAPPIVQKALRSPGHALDSSTRAFFEPRLGRDFSHVRVHTDSLAAESAKSVGALAYTVGRDIVFGSSQYTNSGQSRRLLAHELVHVIQQAVHPVGTVRRQGNPNAAGLHPTVIEDLKGKMLQLMDKVDPATRSSLITRNAPKPIHRGS